MNAGPNRPADEAGGAARRGRSRGMGWSATITRGKCDPRQGAFVASRALHMDVSPFFLYTGPMSKALAGGLIRA